MRIASPTALSLIVSNFPEGPKRNRAFGIYSAMAAAGGAIGLLLGGVFTSYVSWRWIFFVNVPIGAAIVLLTPGSVRESETRSGTLDVPGAVTVTGGMLALVYGLSNAANHTWGSLGTVVPLVVAGVLLVSFLLIETHTTGPLMPLSIFANRNRSASYAIMLCIGTAVFSMFFFLTQFLQNVLGWTPIRTGVGFLPMSAGIGVAAMLTARFVGKVGVRIPLLVGPAFAAIGLGWLSRLSVTSTYIDILGPLLVVAVGMGLTFVPLTMTGVAGVRPEETGLASALLNTGQQVGGALGLAILATIAIDATKSKAHQLAVAAHGHLTNHAAGVATTHGYTTAFEVGSAIALGAVVISLLVIRSPERVPPVISIGSGNDAGPTRSVEAGLPV